MFAIQVREDEERTLMWERCTRPKARPGHVVIRVSASAVNRADLLQRRGKYPVPKGASPILGLEAAGVVEELGEGVTDVRVGQRVAVLLEGGGYAEFVEAHAGMLLAVPDAMSLVDAAALPEVLYTAWLNIWMEGAAQPGERVVVHAGASGVGTAAIQLCQVMGNPCYATASAAKLDRLRALGADGVFDRRSDTLWSDLRDAIGAPGADVILDPVGAAYLAQNVDLLAHQGRLVVIGLLGGARGELPIGTLLMRRLRVLGSVLRSRSREEKLEITASLRERVWPHVANGSVRPIVQAIIPMREAAEAHRLIASNETFGKVVLEVQSTTMESE